jgi:hypothetical protein
MEGWPSQSIFDHNYQFISLSPVEFEVLSACDQASDPTATDSPEARATLTVADLLGQTSATLDDLREMQQKHLILLQPPQLSP